MGLWPLYRFAAGAAATSSVSDKGMETDLMTNVAIMCPKCLSATVSLTHQKKSYGPDAELVGSRKTLTPLAINRTYTCDQCGYIVTHSEPVQDAA
jgi:hypothetical protein